MKGDMWLGTNLLFFLIYIIVGAFLINDPYV